MWNVWESRSSFCARQPSNNATRQVGDVWTASAGHSAHRYVWACLESAVRQFVNCVWVLHKNDCYERKILQLMRERERERERVACVGGTQQTETVCGLLGQQACAATQPVYKVRQYIGSAHLPTTDCATDQVQQMCDGELVLKSRQSHQLTSQSAKQPAHHCLPKQKFICIIRPWRVHFVAWFSFVSFASPSTASWMSENQFL